MKIQVSPEEKKHHNTLSSLLDHILKNYGDNFIVEKVRLDSRYLTDLDYTKLESIKPSDYFEIVVFLEDIESYKEKNIEPFIETLNEIKSLITPCSTAFEHFNLKRANILLEDILNRLNAIMAFVDATNHEGKELVLKKSLELLNSMIEYQEGEDYIGLATLLKEDLMKIMPICENLF